MAHVTCPVDSLIFEREFKKGAAKVSINLEEMSPAGRAKVWSYGIDRILNDCLAGIDEDKCQEKLDSKVSALMTGELRIHRRRNAFEDELWRLIQKHGRKHGTKAQVETLKKTKQPKNLEGIKAVAAKLPKIFTPENWVMMEQRAAKVAAIMADDDLEIEI